MECTLSSNLYRNRLNINLLQISSFRSYKFLLECDQWTLLVGWLWILSTSCKKYSSSLFKRGKFRNISEKHRVSLMLYSFWRRGFTFAGITLLQLYVKAPVSSMIDLNLHFPTVISFIVKRMGISCSKQLC